MELAQVRLLVGDFVASYRFYADVLGLKPQWGAQYGPYEKFSPPGGTAGIALQDRAMMAKVLDELAERPAGYRSLVVLRVDDLDAYCAGIVARGGVLAHGPALMGERIRVAHLKDPEGNLVEVQEWLLPRDQG
ncbi:VOC family protein [Streptomyces sp. VRA16 Mangrove soil]|uniref:VOC family protein n=1 Tax=Streptomyces sp. VRA16 Mangrove soil TaxID=2817434 RepID=UPI001A9FD091|nr:VOC family protein [Streptomyces sp. VRA16 Mangrove soil]MBO1336970.1 VOC family protein [Streptomyces sp. VRA16 Mangrove soil]